MFVHMHVSQPTLNGNETGIYEYFKLLETTTYGHLIDSRNFKEPLHMTLGG